MKGIFNPNVLGSLLLVLSIAGCGGGGGGGGGNDDRGGDDDGTSPVPSLSGVIIDSPIVGLDFQATSGLKGKTSQGGHFLYKAGDKITFSLGSISLPAIEATSVVTPLDLFSTLDINSNNVVNFLRLVQSLDDDGTIDTAITLPPEHMQAIANAGLTLNDLAQPTPQFESLPAISAVFTAIGRPGGLISKQAAVSHFKSILANSALIDSDNDGQPNDQDLDDDNDSTLDALDDFPWNGGEVGDFDDDGLGDNSDGDDDNDGIADADDGDRNLISVLDSSIPAITAHQFAKNSQHLFLTHKNERSISIINLSGGTLEKTIRFEHMPERMTLTPDGRWLYVALLTHEHDPYRNDEDQSGYIAVIDTHSMTLARTISIALDPYDLVVTDAGKLVVSSGSSQWTSIHAYGAETGSLQGSAMIRHKSRLSLHPSGQWVFAANTDVSPSDIEKFDISGEGIAAAGDSPYHGDYRINGNVWATPDGGYLVTRGGDLFLASDMTFVRTITASNVQIENVAFDGDKSVALVKFSNNELHLLNLTTFETVFRSNMGGNVGGQYMAGRYSYFLINSGNQKSLIKIDHPCLGCATNQPPAAAFTYSPQPGTTNDTFMFDAGTSTDPDDGDELEYRWDFDGDNQWDTNFTASRTANFRYTLAGTKFVKLQVKDSLGLTNTVTRNVNVTQGTDTGNSGENGTPFELQANVTDVIVDQHRSKSYVTDQTARRLYIVDMTTGLTERYFNFTEMPERMALSPDGSRLYVALLTQAHSPYVWDEDQSGFIAVFDLDQLARINTFALDIDPFDLVVSANGKLVVTSGSGQWTKIKAYDSQTGTELGASFIRNMSYLSLHPSGNWVFAADTDVSPSDIHKFDISGSGITSLGDSPYHGGYRMGGRVWATPDGEHVITAGGGVYRASDMTFVTNITSEDTSIVHVSYDESEGVALFVLSSHAVALLNLASLEIIRTFDVSDTVDAAFLINDSAYYWSFNTASATIERDEHPCEGCGSNAAPVASFTFTPPKLTTTDRIIFNASASTDAEGAGTLRYRWDFNADGQWDTSLSTTPSASHRYTTAGTKLVHLQVMDTGGLTSNATRTLNITQGIDEGTEVTDSIPFQLPFEITATENDLLRNKLYVTDLNDHRLYIVDLATGLIDKYFEFEEMPERMAVSPDGSRLYVGLLQQPHSPYASPTGYIAVFDLELQARINTFEIDIDPFDLVVSTNGKLVVSSGSGQWTSINAYDAETGAELGSASIRHQSFLSIQPNGNWVFAADTDISPSDIEKFDISGVGITSLGDSPYHGDHRMEGDVWVTPNGSHVITRGGDLFLSSNMTFVKSLTSSGVEIRKIAFDATENVAVLLLSNNTRAVLNLQSFEFLHEMEMLATVSDLFFSGGALYYLVQSGAQVHIAPDVHPCPGCGANTSPVALFTFNPNAGTTTDTYQFDASNSSDAEDGNALQYRWDFDGDGTWDTLFSTSATQSHRYTTAATRLVRLQVKDTQGMTHVAVRSVNVAQGIDPGTEIDGIPPFELPFTITAIKTDTQRGKAYISDIEARRLYITDLTTGITEKYFEFSEMPERMAISPDGSRLYLALLRQEHSYYWWDEDQSGLIAVFDLESQAHINTFEVNIDPYDLVVSQNGKLIIASGSGQWTRIAAYNATSGIYLSSAQTYQMTRLSLHPTGNFVFAANTTVSPSDIAKFDIRGYGITSVGDSPYHGDHRMNGNVWAAPNGNHVITAGGDIFLASNMTFVTSMTSVNLGIEELIFDTNTNSALIIGTDGVVHRYELTTWRHLESTTPNNSPVHLVPWQTGWVITSGTNGQRLEAIEF